MDYHEMPAAKPTLLYIMVSTFLLPIITICFVYYLSKEMYGITTTYDKALLIGVAILIFIGGLMKNSFSSLPPIIAICLLYFLSKVSNGIVTNYDKALLIGVAIAFIIGVLTKKSFYFLYPFSSKKRFILGIIYGLILGIGFGLIFCLDGGIDDWGIFKTMSLNVTTLVPIGLIFTFIAPPFGRTNHPT